MLQDFHNQTKQTVSMVIGWLSEAWYLFLEIATLLFLTARTLY